MVGEKSITPNNPNINCKPTVYNNVRFIVSQKIKKININYCLSVL